MLRDEKLACFEFLGCVFKKTMLILFFKREIVVTKKISTSTRVLVGAQTRHVGWIRHAGRQGRWVKSLDMPYLNSTNN
jgi:hypothetical protein